MPNLLDSCRVAQLPASVRQLAQQSGMKFPLSLRAFIGESSCPFSRCIRIHLKILKEQEPTDFTLSAMLLSMRTVYATADMGVIVGSREPLSGPAFTTLLDVDVGECLMGVTTAEQNQLFQNRNGAGPNDLVIYFVDETVPGFNGCAAHPSGQPGAVVINNCSRWTLAHEIGHVLGLGHIAGETNAKGECVSPDFTRLMTGCGTRNITGTPALVQSEVDTMRSSNFTIEC